jgi:hypothetical protein
MEEISLTDQHTLGLGLRRVAACLLVTYSAPMAHNGDQPNRLALLAGFSIGFLWIAMAIFLLMRSLGGLNNHRPDYGLAWGLAGVLLFAAGVASILGTYWHNLRPNHD